MKKLVPFFMPLVLWAFIVTSSDQLYAKVVTPLLIQNPESSPVGRSAPLPLPIRKPLPIINSVTVLTTNVSVSVMTDGKNWMTLNVTPEALAAAQYNPKTGQKELYLSAEMPIVAGHNQSVKSSASITANTFTSTNNGPIALTTTETSVDTALTAYTNLEEPLSTITGLPFYGGGPQPEIACLGCIIIIVAIIVVMGVVIYIFVQACKALNKLLNKNKDDSLIWHPSDELYA